MALNKKNNRQEQLPIRKASVPRKKKQKKRRGNRVLHHILLTVLLLGVGIFLSLTVFFKIGDIRVSGSDYYTAEEIISATGFQKETNLFLTSTKETANVITTQFPYIESVVVKKTLPPAIDIVLTPSNVAAALEIDGEFVLISDSGKILERGLVLLPSDVILVKGVDINNKLPGEYMGAYKKQLAEKEDSPAITAFKEEQNALLEEQGATELEALSTINYVNSALAKTKFQGITNLDLTSPYHMTVMYENRLLLRLGTEYKLDYKFDYLKEAIASLDPRAHGTLNTENSTDSKKWMVYTPSEGYTMEGIPEGEDKPDVVAETEIDDPEAPAEPSIKSGGSSTETEVLDPV